MLVSVLAPAALTADLAVLVSVNPPPMSADLPVLVTVNRPQTGVRRSRRTVTAIAR